MSITDVMEPFDTMTNTHDGASFSAQNQVGEKHDADKLDWTLLPVRPVQSILQVLAFGAEKYQRDNWQHVTQPRRRYLSAAFRHLAAVQDGEWLDSESGLPHLAHAGCCILFLLWFGNEMA